MKKLIYILTCLLVFCWQFQAQTITTHTHYSVDNGLSENHILSMMQDSKGYMWFGTYDGLNKFDGFSFVNYKGKKQQETNATIFRIDRLREDKSGYIWVQSNDGQVYRFNPSTEQFLPIPQSLERHKEFKTSLNRFTLLNDGSIWLHNNKSGFESCFRINYCASGLLQVTHFNNPKFSENEVINKIYLDKDSNTWLLTTRGIGRLLAGKKHVNRIIYNNTEAYGIYENSKAVFIVGNNGQLFIFYKSGAKLQKIKLPTSQPLVDMQQLKNGKFLFITLNAEVWLSDKQLTNFELLKINKLKSAKAFGFYTDRLGNVWMDADCTMAIYFDQKTEKIQYLAYANNQNISVANNFSVIEDKQQNIWVQVKAGGLYHFNPTKNTLDCIDIQHKIHKSISEIVHLSGTDNQGNLWLSTFLQGVDKLTFTNNSFRFIRPGNADYFSLENEIRSVFQDSKKQIWACSKKGIVYVYSENYELIGTLGKNGTIGKSDPMRIAVYHLMEDAQANIWLGTKGDGLFKLENTSPLKYQITNFRFNEADAFSISSNQIYSIFEDFDKRIWVGTFDNGLNLMDNNNGNVRFLNKRNQLGNYPDEGNQIRFITADKYRQMLIGTTKGLFVAKTDVRNPAEITYRQFTASGSDSTGISGNDVHAILQSKKGDVYIGLLGGGLNRVKGGFKPGTEPKFEHLKSKIGKSPAQVYTLREDNNAAIWLSTQTQIVKFDPENYHFSFYKPMSDHDYYCSEGASCIVNNNKLVYGTSDGLIAFDPLKIKKQNYVPRICFTQLQIANKTIQVNDNTALLQKIIDETPELILSHDQNILSLEYAALDFANPQNIEYAYKLEGLENDWNYVGDRRVANYINLPKGNYTFRVKSTNSDGQWVENERSVRIIKQPSFWESMWGYLFYVLMLLLISGVIAIVLFTFYKLRNEIAIEQRISNLKLRFFTDISHELRTPLTLIISPIESLLKKEKLSDKAREQLEVVQKNTDRMLRLINQILDFRKIQHDKMKLMVEELNVVSFVQDVCSNFSRLSEEKSIELQLINESSNPTLWADKDKLEKILFNLLSNAFKFTQAKRRVDVTIFEDIETISISVRDQGIGINKDRLKLLFERFESFTTDTINISGSTGIGLSLTKELVELHKAEIFVDSEPGKGSVFTVKFKKGTTHFGANTEIIKSEAELPNQKASITETEISDEINTSSDTEKQSILIAEDNLELQTYLKAALDDKYEIRIANNGREAYETALNTMPDLIISDIMMPDMDGITFATKIKNDFNTRHIPFILLTAKVDIDTKVKAMELCVDDYITKPFSITYLEARIENLFKIRKQLQEFYKTSLTSGIITLSKAEFTNPDELFLKKIMQYIEENYSNFEMNIDDMARSIGVSRSSFFKKVKSLTGVAPVDFVREYRMLKAAQLLEAGESNISQLSYSVGILDTKYFSRCFRQKFGINPSEYKKNIAQNQLNNINLK